MMETVDILALAQQAAGYTVAQRRYCHAHPECGPAEQTATMAYIEAQLDELGVAHRRAPGAGVFGFIPGPAGGKTLLLRSDIDALPISEDVCNLKQPKVCVSQNAGVMHACGHDAHIAMLLTQAKLLMQCRPLLRGSVILLFEQNEEVFVSVPPLCSYIQAAGLSIDGCYATHVRWDLPAGQIGYSEPAAMAGLQAFRLLLDGQTGHGSRPDLAHSTVDCFAQIYAAWQALRMDRIRPDTGLTWSVGTLSAGNRFNVIPDHLEATGTIRAFDVESGVQIWQSMQQAVAHLCALNGCRGRLIRDQYLLPTRSDPACLALFVSSARARLGQNAVAAVPAWMASETFSCLSSMYPSVFSFVGIRNEALGSGANHHTPQFDLDESAMTLGVAAAVGYTLDFLATPPDTSSFCPVQPSMQQLVAMLQEQ